MNSSRFGMTLALIIVACGAKTTRAADHAPLHEVLRELTARANSDTARWTVRSRDDASHLDARLTSVTYAVDGLPVFGVKTSIAVDTDGRVRRMVGGVLPATDNGASHPEPPKERVEAWLATRGHEVDSATPGWWVDRAGRLRPVVRAVTRETGGHAPLMLYLDASNGRILRTEPIRWTEADPLSDTDTLGAVFEDNPLTTPTTATVPLRFLDEGSDVLNGMYARVGSCIDDDKCQQVEPLAYRSDASGAEFVFDPALDPDDFDDPFAEVNAYYHISAINHWFREAFGWSGLFAENQWIDVRVGRAWDNAAFYVETDDRGPYIVFGKSGDINYAYDADTIYHEFSHGFNQTLWPHSWASGDEYGLDVAMSGIEEALADMWAQTFTDDPVMNVYVRQSRSALNDATCPNDLYSEGHMEADMLTAFGWEVRETIGSVPFEHILYRSIRFFEDDIDFRDFAMVLEQSADELVDVSGSEVKPWHADTIRQKAIERGLFDDACLNRLVPMVDKETRLVVGYGNRLTNHHDYPFGLQWAITTPNDVQSFKLFLKWHYPLEDEDGNPVDPGFRVHVRRGEPVEVRWLDPDSISEGEPAFEAICDDTFEGSPESVSYPLLDTAPAAPGETFYVLFSADHDEPIIAIAGTLRFSRIQSTPPPSTLNGTTGSDEPVAGSSSGGCALTPPRPTSNSSLIALAELII